MKLYAVRDVTSKESVGIFHCEIHQLADMVDEVTSPQECEFTVIKKPASVIWPNPYSQKWIDTDDEDDGISPATIGGSLYMQIFDKKAKWEALAF